MGHVNQPKEEQMPRLLSLRAISERTTIPRPTLYTLIANGELPVVRIGRSLRVDERDLMAFVRARREGGQAAR